MTPSSQAAPAQKRTRSKPSSFVEASPSPGEVVVSGSEVVVKGRQVSVERPRALASAQGPGEVLVTHQLRTNRLLLRPLRESDRATYIKLLETNTEELDRWIAHRRASETFDEVFDRHLAFCTIGDEKRTACRRVVVLDDGQIAGCVNLNAITRGLAFEGEMSWWISSEFQRRGLAAESGLGMLDHAFFDLPQGLGLHRVTAVIHGENVRSIGCAATMGFRRVPGGDVRVRTPSGWETRELHAISVTDWRGV